MADDTRVSSSSSNTWGATSSTTAGAGALPKKYPKGVVLGKDGKPCRACTSFAAWSSMTAATLSTPAPSPQSSSSSSPITFPSNQTSSSSNLDCPPDVDSLGRSTWTLLHSITASYPVSPPLALQNDTRAFLSLFAKLYPCWVCAEDFQAYMEREKVRVGSRAEFGRWMCDAHNEVNRKLGKELFNCNRWEERWRTGCGGDVD